MTFGGQRIDELSDDARTRLRRHEFGIVLQFSQLVPELTAEQNVARPLLLERGCTASALARWQVLSPVSSLVARRSGWRWRGLRTE